MANKDWISIYQAAIKETRNHRRPFSSEELDKIRDFVLARSGTKKEKVAATVTFIDYNLRKEEVEAMSKNSFIISVITETTSVPTPELVYWPEEMMDVVNRAMANDKVCLIVVEYGNISGGAGSTRVEVLALKRESREEQWLCRINGAWMP